MKFMLVLLFIVYGFQRSSAQSTVIQPDSLKTYLSFEEPTGFGFLLEYFPPFFIQHGMELKSFIRSRTFDEIRRKYGDLKALDAVFIHAMKLTNDNTAVSLLLSTFACFDHRIVGLKIPVFALAFPLSDESSEEFNSRVKNLPRKLYPDTPRIPSGDRDKLQHFYGAAFIAFTFESDQPAERFSEFIEQGEDAIIVDGVLDERDKRASRNGEKFGLALLKNNHLVPSEFLDPHFAAVNDLKNDSKRGIPMQADTAKTIGDKK
jgi:hypothetical protein